MYAAVSDMQATFKAAELIQLTDEAGLGVIDEAKIVTALMAADNLINSYIAGTYDLPLPSTPAILADYACDIARFRLYRDEVPEAVQDRYDAALVWLKDIARGVVKLDIAGTEPVSAPATIIVDTTVLCGVRDKYRGF